MLNPKQVVVMTVSNKAIYHISRTLHILLLPILYLGIVWFLGDKWWQIIGLILLFIIPFYKPIFKKYEKFLFFLRLVTYILIILIFFPTELFSKEYFLDYKNIIFYDICFMMFVDIRIYRKNKIKVNT